MKRTKNVLLIMICALIAMSLLTACKSKSMKKMEATVESAQELLDKGEKPYDVKTKQTLESIIKGAEDAKKDEECDKVTKDINDARKAFEDSVKQQKQITNPSEEFLIKRAKKVVSINKVEAATEDTDENDLMNKEGGYTSYIAMKSSWVKDDYYDGMSPVKAGTDGGAVIEAFNNEKEAKAREEYLATFDGSGAMASGSHKVIGTLLIRTSNELKASQQKKLEQSIIDELIRLE